MTRPAAPAVCAARRTSDEPTPDEAAVIARGAVAGIIVRRAKAPKIGFEVIRFGAIQQLLTVEAVAALLDAVGAPS